MSTATETVTEELVEEINELAPQCQVQQWHLLLGEWIQCPQAATWWALRTCGCVRYMCDPHHAEKYTGPSACGGCHREWDSRPPAVSEGRL